VDLDRLFGGRRGRAALIMICGMMLATVFLAVLGSRSVALFTVGIASSFIFRAGLAISGAVH